eukprot:jgi/Orpsp1_1/1191614/evm.model.d7180000087355.1
MKKNSTDNLGSTSSLNKSNRQERIDLIERAKQRLSEIRIKKNSTIESKNEVDEDDPLGIKKQTSYAPQPLNFSYKKLSPPTEFSDKDSKPSIINFVPEAGISIKKDNNFPQLKKRFSKFQSRGFSRRLGRDLGSSAIAAEGDINTSSSKNILGEPLTSSPLNSLPNSNQDVSRSSYRLRGRNSDTNKTSTTTANTNTDSENYEKKKYKVHGLENLKDVFKSAIEDDIKKEQSVEYESPEEK